MNRRIIFISSPLGFHKKFIVDKTEEIFNITENEKRLYFTLGSNVQLPSEEDFWPKIQTMIDKHLAQFPESTFIYYGWQVLEYLDQLRATYTDAKHLGFYLGKDPHAEFMIAEILANLYDIPRDELVIRNRMIRHYDKLEEYYNLGEPVVTILNGYQGKDNSRKCFIIN
jgi:hypothetical protein